MAAAAGRPARAQSLRDLLGDLAAGQVGREQAGGGDGAGGARAVRDHHGSAQAEQDGSAVALCVEPRGEFAQPAALQERADAGGPRAGHRGAQLGRREPDRALERLQRHVPGEAVGHDHVELAGQQVTALHVAREAQRERAVRRIAGQQLMRAPGELVPLPRFGPDRQQPYLGVGHAQRGLRVSHAELAELDEHLRLGVGGRARVDEHRPARAGRQHDGEPGPQHAGQRPQPQPRGRHDAAGGPGRYHRGGVAAPDQLARHRHARPRAAQAGQRALVHRQVVLGRHDLDLVDGAQPAEHLAQPGRRSGQQDPDAVLALGGERPGDDLTGGVIPAHGVDRDHRAGRAGPRARRAVVAGARDRPCFPGRPRRPAPGIAAPGRPAPYSAEHRGARPRMVPHPCCAPQPSVPVWWPHYRPDEEFRRAWCRDPSGPGAAGGRSGRGPGARIVRLKAHRMERCAKTVVLEVAVIWPNTSCEPW